MNNRERYVYYLYSSKQKNDKMKIQFNTNNKYIPNKVKTKSGYKEYTEVSTSPNNNYSDTIIVAQGYESNMVIKKGE